MRKTHNNKNTLNTTGYTVTKLFRHYLSHRYNLRDQMIVYHRQHKSLPKYNDYSIDLNSYSQFINLSEMLPHLNEFKIIIHSKTKFNHYIIIECERTRPIMLITHFLQQPLSVIPTMTNSLILESGWVFFTDSNTHHLNFNRHLAFFKK